MQELEDSTHLIGDDAALRAAFAEDGVILFRGLMDGPALHAARDDIARILVEHGWVTDADTLETTPVMVSPGQPGFGDVYGPIQALESVHRLAWEAALTGTVQRLFDEPVFGHPGHVVRMMPHDPDGTFRTHPHQDFAVLQTTADLVTCWFPLHDCGPDRAPLLVQPGSHRRGLRRPDADGYGPFDVFLAEDPDDVWASVDFRAGDVLAFHGLTIHASAPNRSPFARVSVECRYQPVADPIFKATLRPNRPREVPGWDVLTQGWSTTEWIEVPEEVEVVVPPKGTRFDEMLAALEVPPSRFVGAT